MNVVVGYGSTLHFQYTLKFSPGVFESVNGPKNSLHKIKPVDVSKL